MNSLLNNNLIILTLVIFLFISCDQPESQNQNQNQISDPVTSVMTKESQAELTPQEILEGLKEGNERYAENELTPRDYQAQASKTADGRYPEAIIISCVDSRVPVEHVFDKGVGDIFVARVAGNFVNEDILGSAEFATAAAGSKVVIVMGHESCGAVKSAIDGVEMGNITAMLDKIEPAIDMTENFDGEQASSNNEYVTEVVNNNVVHTISEMRERSSIIADLERNGDIVIAGAFYDLDTG